MPVTKRRHQRKQRPQLLKSRLAELARLEAVEDDAAQIKGEGHGFAKLDHFKPDEVERRIAMHLEKQ